MKNVDFKSLRCSNILTVIYNPNKLNFSERLTIEEILIIFKKIQN